MNPPAPRRDGINPGILVGALAALAGGVVTLQTAREKSLSVVNDPSIIALVMNGAAALLLGFALWKLIPKKGLVVGLLGTALWFGGTGLLLNLALEKNAAAAHRKWDSERALNRVQDMCSGRMKRDERAKAFDPAAKTHGKIVVRDSGIASTAPYVRTDNGLGIEDADLLICAKDSEETVERCTYDGYRTMSRVRVDSEVRFISIKTGEELWRTNLTGAAPRACEHSERFSERSMSGTIRGNAPDPIVAYNQFIAR
jgi:hypothetical protein